MEIKKVFPLEGDWFGRIFEDNPAGMIIAGPDLRYIKANPAFCRMIGYADGDLHGTRITDLVHSDDREITSDLLERLLKDEIACMRLEKRYLKKNGGLLWGNTTVYPARDALGKQLYLIGMVEDITEKKQKEEDSALLSAAVSSSADAVVITGTSGKIRYVNWAFEKITGYQRKEVLGSNLKDLAQKTGQPSFGNAFDETVRSGSPWTGTATNIRKDGTPYTVEETIAPVRNRAGRVVNVIIMERDVTEKLRLESIAEAVNTMDNIGYIFSGIRHEIGNPVSSVKMALSVLRSKLDDGCTKELIERYLDRAMAELSRMEYLLKTLKSFNIYESPDAKDMDMTAFTGNLSSLLVDDFRKKGIQIGVMVQPGAGCAHADPRALQQVMLNIITNAADALEGKPSPRIDIKIMKMGGRILIHVEDNGCGMSPSQVRDAFRPFYTTKPTGTGLGLMLAKKMITRMNGTIEISSQQGVGTAVDIFIPEGKDGK
ncbi:MAG: PAS domain S-box protein [Nitrospiraceae bacterium]|nr:PAS domain S-box protein [Nitrospiraceae bacterium]